MQKQNNKNKKLFIEIGIIVSICISMFFFLFLPQYHEVEGKVVIEAEGIIKDSSLMEGVQIIHIKVDGKNINLADFFNRMDWLYENESYIWNYSGSDNQRVEAAMKFHMLEITFKKNAWYGGVNIYVNDCLEEKIDFYSDNDMTYVVKINGLEFMPLMKRIQCTFLFIIIVNILLIIVYSKNLVDGNENNYIGRYSKLIKKNRTEWIDIVKGIGILLVILGHSLVENAVILRIIWSVHMPLFFVVAGYTFKERKLQEQIKRDSKRLIIPYIAGVGILLISDIISHIITNGIILDISNMIWDYIGRGIYGSGGYSLSLFQGIICFNPIGAIWFFCAMFLARIMFNYIFRIKDTYRFIIVCGISYIGIMITKLLSDKKGIWLPWSLQAAMTALIFMYIGYLVHQEEIMKYKEGIVEKMICCFIWVFVFYCGSGVYMVVNSYPLGILDFVGALCGSACIVWFSQLISKYTQILKKILIFLGQNTAIILIFHLVELNFINWKNILDCVIGSGMRSLGQLIFIFIAKVLWCTLFVIFQYQLKKGINLINKKI